MSTIRLLFRSRKFVVALGGLVLAALIHVVGFDAATAETLTYLIMALASAYIVGHAVEDAARKLHNGRTGDN